MREALFIKRNKDRWEKIQGQASQDADETAADFTRLLDDLAYAKSFYPGSQVTQFLNSQASRIYLSIYRNRKEEHNRLVSFWKYDVPLTVRKHHGVMAFALVLFVLFFAVGFFSARNDPGFVRDVLGDNYVDMTEENIANGNPLGVYSQGTPILSFVGFMLNNIAVSFFYFAKGLSLGILTMTSLGKEAIRLGAFEHMFFTKGYGLESAMGVLLHGLLELTAIILACGAGIVLGKSVLFPGTISRLDSLKQGAKDGVKIVVGMMPLFIVAAFLEAFVTRFYRMPFILNLSLLLVSFVFVIWYFIIYPVRLEKKLAVRLEEEEV